MMPLCVLREEPLDVQCYPLKEHSASGVMGLAEVRYQIPVGTWSMLAKISQFVNITLANKPYVQTKPQFYPVQGVYPSGGYVPFTAA